MRSMSEAGSEPDATPVSRIFLVQGRVQGVGFRWWTRTQALRLGISGSVRNLGDGSVEVRARGSRPALVSFARMLSEGPPGARVSGVEQRPGGDLPDGDFEIER